MASRVLQFRAEQDRDLVHMIFIAIIRADLFAEVKAILFTLLLTILWWSGRYDN